VRCAETRVLRPRRAGAPWRAGRLAQPPANRQALTRTPARPQARWPKLAVNDGNQDAIRESGGIPPLVALLEREPLGQSEVVLVALAAVAALAAHPPNHDALLQAGATDAMVHLLDAGPTVAGGGVGAGDSARLAEALGRLPRRHPAARRRHPAAHCAAGRRAAHPPPAAAAQALWYLSRNGENCDEIRIAGGVAPLVELLAADMALPAVAAAASALWMLAESNAAEQGCHLRGWRRARAGAPAVGGTEERRHAQGSLGAGRSGQRSGVQGRHPGCGGRAPLVALLSAGANEEVTAVAASTLAKLADTSPGVREAVRNARRSAPARVRCLAGASEAEGSAAAAGQLRRGRAVVLSAQRGQQGRHPRG
jgi:hypothetical protein